MDRTRITGYIFIKLSGLGIEQDIKKMLAAGIKLHDCRRESYTSLTARCSVRDGKKLKKLGINAQIIRSGGIIPALLAARTRYGLFAAAAVVTAAIILLQGRVFLLDIKGLDAVSRQDMEEALFFYEYASTKGKAFLEQHNYSEEEVLDGLKELARRSGCEEIVELI